MFLILVRTDTSGRALFQNGDKKMKKSSGKKEYQCNFKLTRL